MTADPIPTTQNCEKVRGVFSTSVKARIGFGDTRKNVDQRVLFFIIESDDGKFAVQALNHNHVPTGEVRWIDRDRLLKEFVPEPNVFADACAPAMEKLAQTVDRAEDHHRNGELYSAESEYKNALKIDEAHVRATFGLGMTYLDRGESDKGDLVFRRIAAMKTALDPEHKHLFNEFGLKLRKARLYTQALKHYARAYKLAPNDEHLLYNMARAFFDKGSLKQAETFLLKSIALNPDFTEARKMLALVRSKHSGGSR